MQKFWPNVIDQEHNRTEDGILGDRITNSKWTWESIQDLHDKIQGT